MDRGEEEEKGRGKRREGGRMERRREREGGRSLIIAQLTLPPC